MVVDTRASPNGSCGSIIDNIQESSDVQKRLIEGVEFDSEGIVAIGRSKRLFFGRIDQLVDASSLHGPARMVQGISNPDYYPPEAADRKQSIANTFSKSLQTCKLKPSVTSRFPASSSLIINAMTFLNIEKTEPLLPEDMTDKENVSDLLTRTVQAHLTRFQAMTSKISRVLICDAGPTPYTTALLTAFYMLAEETKIPLLRAVLDISESLGPVYRAPGLIRCVIDIAERSQLIDEANPPHFTRALTAAEAYWAERPPSPVMSTPPTTPRLHLDEEDEAGTPRQLR